MLTNFPNGITSFGVPVLGSIGGATLTGNFYFVNPATGADGNDGTIDLPLKTLYRAYQLCRAGNNDVVVLISDGTTASTARLSTELSQSITPAANDGTLTWAKDATHLVGVCSPTRVGQRARIAPPTGTYPQGNFNSLAFVNVTASGCYFANLSVYCGFSTGQDGMIAWTDSGSRNAYNNVNIQGMADAASAAGSSSRTLKLVGGGERTFTNCVLGTSTVARSAANATIEFTSGTARNAFIGCTLDFQTSAATPLGIKAAAAASMDRYQLFQDCTFINNVGSTSTTMSGLSTIAASSGGLILMKNPTMVGITEFGTDATTRGQIYVDGGTPTAGTTGIAVNPT